MLNTIYANQSQFTDLLNAIQGGDTTAIVTALGQIKTSIDTINTALGSLSTGVTQDTTQWTNLINAISSGSGGGTVDIDATQWSNLLTEITKGDMTATATALSNIYTRLTSIGFDSTQWTNLINAISSGGGGGGGTVSIDSTQWSNLLTEVAKGDNAALVTLLTTISGTLAQMKLDLDAVAFDTTQWNALITAVSRSIVTAGVTQDATQWSNLLTSVDKADMSTANTELGNIDSTLSTNLASIDTSTASIASDISGQSSIFSGMRTDISGISTALDTVGINSTQWTNLINALNAASGYTANRIMTSSNDGKPSTTSISTTDFNNIFTPTVSTQTGDFFDVEVWLCGGTKHIAFNGSAKQAISTGWQASSITLPAQYRPSSQVLRGVMVRQGSNNIYVTISIASTGIISINTTIALTSGTPLRFEFTYT